jgi:hypothetical protein
MNGEYPKICKIYAVSITVISKMQIQFKNALPSQLKYDIDPKNT